MVYSKRMRRIFSLDLASYVLEKNLNFLLTVAERCSNDVAHEPPTDGDSVVVATAPASTHHHPAASTIRGRVGKTFACGLVRHTARAKTSFSGWRDRGRGLQFGHRGPRVRLVGWQQKDLEEPSHAAGRIAPFAASFDGTFGFDENFC